MKLFALALDGVTLFPAESLTHQLGDASSKQARTELGCGFWKLKTGARHNPYSARHLTTKRGLPCANDAATAFWIMCKSHFL
jgi:hypothetical protein